MNVEINRSDQLYYITRLTPNAYNWERPSGKEGKCVENQIYEAIHGFGWEEWLLNDLKNETESKDGYCYGFIQAFNDKNNHFQQIDKLFLYTRKLENKKITNYYVGYIENVQILNNILDINLLCKKYKRFCETARQDLQDCDVKNFENELLLMCKTKKFYNVRFKSDNAHFSKQYDYKISLNKGQFRFALYDLKQHSNLANEILRIENNINS
jgi:hypothetical protein